MTLYGTQGTRFFIGGALSMADSPMVLSDFDDQPWVEFRRLINIGKVGGTANFVDVVTIGSGFVRRLKTPADPGDMEVVMAASRESTAQARAVTARDSTSPYAFKVEMNDGSEGGTNSKRYFCGFVSRADDVFDDANALWRFSVGIVLDSNIVRVDGT